MAVGEGWWSVITVPWRRISRSPPAVAGAAEQFDPESFVAAGWSALEGRWSSPGADVGRAAAFGPDGGLDRVIPALARGPAPGLDLIRRPRMPSADNGCAIMGVWTTTSVRSCARRASAAG